MFCRRLRKAGQALPTKPSSLAETDDRRTLFSDP
ncbi:unnamed protein product [Ixodes pacificus]